MISVEMWELKDEYRDKKNNNIVQLFLIIEYPVFYQYFNGLYDGKGIVRDATFKNASLYNITVFCNYSLFKLLFPEHFIAIK